jgi:hypothetical protein
MHPADAYAKLLRARKTTPKVAALVYRRAVQNLFHFHDLVPVHLAIQSRWGTEGFDQITLPVLRRSGLIG